MEGIQTFKGSWPWPWPWILPYGIPSCITHRPLPIYQISLKSKKFFCGRTDVRTDIFPPSNIIRLTFGSRPKHNYSSCLQYNSILGQQNSISKYHIISVIDLQFIICVLSLEAQCIVIAPVCGFVCVCVFVECGFVHTDHKTTPKWAWPGSRDSISKFWDPL